MPVSAMKVMESGARKMFGNFSYELLRILERIWKRK
jgi:hypothetical protein